MAIQEQLYTATEFWEMARLPENNEKRLELINGVIVELAPSSPKNTVIAAKFVYYLNTHVIPNDLGYVTGADGGFTLGPYQVRLPDAAFISKERVPELTDSFNVAPDLAVEVVSPNERPTQILNKVSLYLRAGTRLVWVAYPDDRVVDVCRLSPDGGVDVQTVTVEGALDGEDVLPGFSLPLKLIFPAE
jgi:Uma2 family endonuclease